MTEAKAINFYSKILQAVSSSAESTSEQQAVDAKTTELNAELENKVFDLYTGKNGLLQKAADQVSDIAQQMSDPNNQDQDKQNELGAKLQAAQTEYQQVQAEYEKAKSQASSNTEGMKNQVGLDNSNQKAVVALMQDIVGVASNIASLLSR